MSDLELFLTVLMGLSVLGGLMYFCRVLFDVTADLYWAIRRGVKWLRLHWPARAAS